MNQTKSSKGDSRLKPTHFLLSPLVLQKQIRDYQSLVLIYRRGDKSDND